MEIPLEKVSYPKISGVCGQITERTPEPFCCPEHRNKFIEEWCEKPWIGEEQDGSVKIYREALSFAVDGTMSVVYKLISCFPDAAIPPFCCDTHRGNLLHAVDEAFNKAITAVKESGS